MDYCHFLDVRKPRGLTSFAVVARVRRIAGTRRVGHLGTLDPMAEGVLPLALGRATRLIEYVSGDKRYTAEVTLGVSTATLDAEGEVVERRDPGGVPRAAVEEALAHIAAQTEQVPPMASALHHDGRRLYELFREGTVVEVPARPVRIDAMTLEAFLPPRLVIDVACGPGTYIRSIARDLGARLGCGAHLSALTRTRRGPFRIEDAVTLEMLESDGVAAWLRSPRAVVDGLPWHRISDEGAVAARQGRRVTPEALAGSPAVFPDGVAAPEQCALCDEQGELVAIGRWVDGEVQPLKVFVGESSGGRP